MPRQVAGSSPFGPGVAQPPRLVSAAASRAVLMFSMMGLLVG